MCNNCKKVSSVMTVDEMERLYKNREMSAAEICKLKYDKLLIALSNGEHITTKSIMASTCALCYKHDGNCYNCGIFIETDYKCSGDNDGQWGKIYEVIGEYEEMETVGKDRSFVLNKCRLRINDMISLLDDIITNDSDSDEDFSECRECGEHLRNDDEVFTVDCECYCENCYTETFSHCDECGSEIYTSDASFECGDCYCENCYSEKFTVCDCCDDLILRDDSHYDENDGETLCENCWDDRYVYCDCCENATPIDEIEEYEGEELCENCLEEKTKDKTIKWNEEEIPSTL